MTLLSPNAAGHLRQKLPQNLINSGIFHTLNTLLNAPAFGVRCTGLFGAYDSLLASLYQCSMVVFAYNPKKLSFNNIVLKAVHLLENLDDPITCTFRNPIFAVFLARQKPVGLIFG